MRPNWLNLKSTRGDAPRADRWSTRVRRTLFGALASVLALVGLVAFATPSFAHDDAVTGASACATPLGTGYVVTWTISNDFNSAVKTGTVTGVTGGKGTLSATSFTIPATTHPSQPETAVITQTLPANFTPTTLNLHITSRWDDTTFKADTGTASIADLNCAAAPTQTLAGHIFLCGADGNPTTTEESGGTVGATGAQTVPTQGNPLTPINVNAGGYTMTATPPSGFILVACGGNSTPTSDGSSATEAVTVPSGGAGVGIFYVTASAPVTTPTTIAPTQPVTSPSQTPPVSTAPVSTAPATSPTSTAAPASLAFTGAPVGKEWIFGLGALMLGSGLILASRLRTRRPRHAASKQQ
jgi:hypothetical protein